MPSGNGSGVASPLPWSGWPGPILIATIGLCLVDLLALPGYRTDYNDRHYLPPDIPAAEGFAAAERHFPAARLSPELLMIQGDHDLRNSADFLVIDRVGQSNVPSSPDIARCRPSRSRWALLIEHTIDPVHARHAGRHQTLNQSYLQNRMDDMLKLGDDMQASIDNMQQMYDLMGELNAIYPQHGRQDARDGLRTFRTCAITSPTSTTSSDRCATHFYWEPHCFDIPVCWAVRSVFDSHRRHRHHVRRHHEPHAQTRSSWMSSRPSCAH